jgi:hypothetical protein
MAETETPVPAPSTPDLAALSSKDLSQWRLTGEVASPADPSTEADSSPAKPAKQAASTDATTQPASEPGTPKKANADTRKAELNAEIQALLKQRDEIKASLGSTPRPTAPPDVPAASSPAAQPVSLESVIRQPDLAQPALGETAFYTQFPEATVADYVRYVTRFEVLTNQRDTERVQSVRQREAAYAERVQTALAATPDLIARLPQPLLAAVPTDLLDPSTPVGPWNVALQEVINAEQPQQVMAYLADHPEIVTKIEQSRSQSETIRIIAQIDARLTAASVPPKPTAKAVTSAPPPPPSLGSKPSIPGDELEEALATGDVGKYMREANRREMAGLL